MSTSRIHIMVPKRMSTVFSWLQETGGSQVRTSYYWKLGGILPVLTVILSVLFTLKQ